jgi:hypothetical protein
MSCHEFVVVILPFYGVNVTPPHEHREAARPSSICLQDIRSSGIHNACKLSSPLWAGYNVTHRLHWCVRFQMIWMIQAQYPGQYSGFTMKIKLNPCISSRAYSYYITTGCKLQLALPFLPFHQPLPPNLLARDPSINNHPTGRTAWRTSKFLLYSIPEIGNTLCLVYFNFEDVTIIVATHVAEQQNSVNIVDWREWDCWAESVDITMKVVRMRDCIRLLQLTRVRSADDKYVHFFCPDQTRKFPRGSHDSWASNESLLTSTTSKVCWWVKS